MALQNAESRGESFSKEDFLEGRVGARMVPEDFNFEVNVRFPLLTIIQTQVPFLPDTDFTQTRVRSFY